MRSPPSQSPSFAPLLDSQRRSWTERCGAGSGTRSFFAPGRVNLMGAHLDYNGGPVFPTAIDRGTLVSIALRSDRRLRLFSSLEARAFEGDLAALPSERGGAWYDYPLGVVIELLRLVGERAGALRGADVLFGGNLPIGAGLSSSASICVATATAFDRVWELELPIMERVHVALRAERGFVGVQCGIMDPYAVGLARPGMLLWLDCKDASYEHVPFPYERVSIAVVDTGVRRELARGEFNRRVAESRTAYEVLRRHHPAASCLRDVPLAVLEQHASELEPAVERRARHVLSEVARTFAARQALLEGRLADFGHYVQQTHASLRDLYEVSVPELDRIADSANALACVIGARLTGAGFGGCAVMLVERGAEEEAARRVSEDFSRAFGRSPTIAYFGGDEGPREIA